MHSVAFTFILLVVMVTNDVTASTELSSQNGTDASNGTDVSMFDVSNDTDVSISDVSNDTTTDVITNVGSDVSNYTGNSTDAISDVSDDVIFDDDTEPSTQDVIGGKEAPSKKADGGVCECALSADQYDYLAEKLMEITLQQELMQTAVDRIEVASTSAARSADEGRREGGGAVLCRQNNRCNRARQLYNNLSMLFLFPVIDDKLSTGVNATFNASCYG